jgi:hypothetical protein
MDPGCLVDFPGAHVTNIENVDLLFEKAVTLGTRKAPGSQQRKLWGRLRDACICLGLKAEADYYATLDKGAWELS